MTTTGRSMTDADEAAERRRGAPAAAWHREPEDRRVVAEQASKLDVVERSRCRRIVVQAACPRQSSPRRCCRSRSTVPQTMLSPSPVAVPHTMLSPSVGGAPDDVVAVAAAVPQTMLSQSGRRSRCPRRCCRRRRTAVPQTMLSPSRRRCPRRCCRRRPPTCPRRCCRRRSAVPHTMLSQSAVPHWPCPTRCCRRRRSSARAPDDVQRERVARRLDARRRQPVVAPDDVSCSRPVWSASSRPRRGGGVEAARGATAPMAFRKPAPCVSAS